MAEPTVHVLLIDDDSSTFELMCELFNERYPGRFAFDWAGSFDDGLTAIRQARHDVYLIDHCIGGQRGVELVATVAAECQAPLIVTSEHENQDLDVAALRTGAADCLAAGMDSYIAKPIRQQKVVTVLRQSLAGETGLFRLTAEQDALAPVDDDSKRTAATGTRQLNWKQALHFVANDQDLLSEVLAAFVEECPDLQARLQQATATEDWLTVAKTVHTLQAALRLFEGEVLELAIALEDSCKRGGPDESHALFEKFSGELENVLAEVQGFLRDR